MPVPAALAPAYFMVETIRTRPVSWDPDALVVSDGVEPPPWLAPPLPYGSAGTSDWPPPCHRQPGLPGIACRPSEPPLVPLLLVLLCGPLAVVDVPPPKP